MARVCVALGLALALAGCTRHYVNPDTRADIERDAARCRSQAAYFLAPPAAQGQYLDDCLRVAGWRRTD